MREKRELHTLIVDDNEDDAFLMVEALRRGGYEPRFVRVQTADSLGRALTEREWDVILCDHAMPGFDSRAALRIFRASGLDTPFIIVSGTLGEDIAVESLKLGADDYVLKQNIRRLVPALERSFVDAGNRRRVRAAESALRDNESFLRAILDGLSANIAVLDETGTIVMVNGAWRSFAVDNGAAVESVCEGANYLSVCDASGTAGEQFAAVAREVIQGRVSGYEMEYPCDGPDKKRWFVARVSQVPGGTNRRVVVSHQDITARKQAEQALSHSEQRYRNLVETAFDWVWEIDAEARYTYVSPRVRDLLGYEPAEVLGKTPFDLMPEEEVRRVAALFSASAEKRIPFSNLENTNRHRDGRLVVLESSGVPVFAEDGTFRGYRGMDRDVTGRKRAEEQVRILSRAVEQSPVSVVITDLNGTIQYTNPKFTKVTGYSAEEVLGKNPRVLKSNEMPVEHYRRLWEALAAGEDWSGEFKNRKKNGEIFWEFAWISPVRDAAGTPYRYIAIKEDITARRLLEDQLRQAQKMEAIGQLAGGVAHDFNNILAGMMMLVGLMQTYPDLDTRVKQGLREIEADAQRAANLTRQLLMFGRKSVLSMRVVDLNGILENLLKMLRRIIGEQVSLQFSPAPGLPRIKADIGMIEQIVMNLTVNARDAMPGGGKIVIRTAVLEVVDGDSNASLGRKPGAYACLSVSDTGQGMDDATLKRIFDPFFTTKESGKGTGLGLATVYGIVGQHDGWVTVESTPGNGSVFCVCLPVLEVTEQAPAEPEKPAPSTSGKESVLLVEDEASVRQVVAQCLRRFGYRVVEARNGQEAITFWEEYRHQFDLLFTDMVMPEGITGRDLAARLRRTRPDLKVIISSGYSAEIMRAGAPTEEGIYYLPKPFEVSTLGSAVRNCLDR
jgi:two-component system, cell cycle sensor histidine kinase and response regulator CckA